MDDSHQPGPPAGLTRHALFAAGSVSLALGIIGVFVPLLPTTPFLLLAAACYIRSSPRAHHWLVGNRVLGAYIRGYRSGAGLPLSVKLITLCVLWITIGYSALYGHAPPDCRTRPAPTRREPGIAPGLGWVACRLG